MARESVDQSNQELQKQLFEMKEKFQQPDPECVEMTKISDKLHHHIKNLEH